MTRVHNFNATDIPVDARREIECKLRALEGSNPLEEPLEQRHDVLTVTIFGSSTNTSFTKDEVAMSTNPPNLRDNLDTVINLIKGHNHGR